MSRNGTSELSDTNEYRQLLGYLEKIKVDEFASWIGSHNPEERVNSNKRYIVNKFQNSMVIY